MPSPSIPGLKWPSIANPAAALRALLLELERLERVDSADLSRGQALQLATLHRHFAAHSEFYRRRCEDAGLNQEMELAPDTLSALPVMTRRDVQNAGDSLFCNVPTAHLPVSETKTSGSSGEPVMIKRTAVTQLFWLAYGMREHLWWKRDLKGTLAVIRANLSVERVVRKDWGPPASLLAETGSGYAFSMALDTAAQAAQLAEINPHYLMTYPNNLADLLRHVEANSIRLSNLRQVRSLGETLPQSLRDEVRRVLGVSITDTYSSQEVGVIAMECPESGLYHLMAENLIVEVLDEWGNPCGPGEVGQVVVTDLHNFATPIIRYAIGDLAEAGMPCTCGRTLPTIKRIVGRNRNIAVYPDGKRRYPVLGFARFREIAPIIQYQAIQLDRHTIEFSLVTGRPLLGEEERALADVVQQAMGYPFKIDFRYFNERIPRGPNGKFEEFICQVKD